MSTLLQDLRFAFRLLLKSPGFTIVAVLSLAIAIGANTAMFSVINVVMLRALPFKDPGRLMMLHTEMGEMGKSPWSYPLFQEFRRSTKAFEDVSAFGEEGFNLSVGGEPMRTQVEFVSANYFPMLGIEAEAGRTFRPEEDEVPNRDAVALMSKGLWQRLFGEKATPSGQVIHLNKVPFNVIGVLPEDFEGQSGATEVWVPVMMAPTLTFPERLTDQYSFWHYAMGRLKPDATVDQARAELALLTDQFNKSGLGPPGIENWALRVVPIREAKLDPGLRKPLLILFAAVGFVLLLACINLANLLLARGIKRHKEIAIRLAVGASRRHLIRQLFTESILLALLGGVLGLVVTYWGINLLTSFQPASIANRPGLWAKYVEMTNFNKLQIDGLVLAFNFGISFATGILFGLLPAIQASRTNVYGLLRKDTGSEIMKPSRGRFSAKAFLIPAEIALALVLLVGAGLIIRSFAQLQSIDLGFTPDNVLSLAINLPKTQYTSQARTNFFKDLVTHVESLPGVQAVSPSSSVPLSSNTSSSLLTIQGRQLTAESLPGMLTYHTVGPKYFETLKIPIIKGRSFNEFDRQGARRVAIINEAAEQLYFNGQDPLGQKLQLSVGWEPEGWAEIVGVAKKVKYGNVEQEVTPDVYVCYLQYSEVSRLILRTANDPESIVPALRREVMSMDSSLPISEVRTMQERIGNSTSRAKFITLVLGIFGGIALILAGVGIYGVMAYAVSNRTNEIGIRMALGAQRGDILRLVMADGLILTVFGLAGGVAASLALTGVLSSILYGISATDIMTYAIAALVLAAIAVLAIYIPARRAMKVDPIIALRYE